MKNSFLLTIVSVILMLHCKCCMGSLNYKETLYNGFDLLAKVASSIVRTDTFPELYDNQKLRQAVRPVCPLIDRQKELKRHILSGEAFNVTELEAAETVLAYVLNDTCKWIQSYPSMKNFSCTNNDFDGLQALCIQMTVRDIAEDQRNKLYNIYSSEGGVNKATSRYNKEWLKNNFNGPDTSVIDQVIRVLKTHRSFKKCSRKKQTVSC